MNANTVKVDKKTYNIKSESPIKIFKTMHKKRILKAINSSHKSKV